MEWARYQIRVNAICPGYIETEMNSAFWKTPGGQRLIERIPQRRIGQPEHLDGALLRAFGKGAKERIVPLGRPARLARSTGTVREGGRVSARLSKSRAAPLRFRAAGV